MRYALVALLAACHNHGPPAPTCEAVADHVLSLVEPKDDRAHKIHDAFARRCKDDKWAGDVLHCVRDEPALGGGHHCLDKLTSEQRSALSRELVAAEKPDLPKECEVYKASEAKLDKCDKLQQVNKAQYKNIYDGQASQWDERTRATVAGLASGCHDNNEMVENLLKAVGC